MSVSLYVGLLLATVFCGTLQMVTIDVLGLLSELQEQNEVITGIDADVTHDAYLEDNDKKTYGGWGLLIRPEFSDSYLEDVIEDPDDSSGAREEGSRVSSSSPYRGSTSHNDLKNPKMIKNKSFPDSSNMDEVVKPVFKQSFMNLSDIIESGELNESDSQMASTDLNELIDFVIEVVRKEILKKGIDQIPIGDIDKEFTKRIGFIKVRGKFEGRQGWFKRLSTLHRTANVIATRQGDSLIISLGMGLGTMEFGFNRYKAEILHIGTKGNLRAKVDSNSINAQVSIAIVDDKCKITLQQLQITQFSGLSIHVTGLGKLSWLLSKIFTWVTNRFKDKIIKNIEKHLAQVVVATLAKTHC